MRKAMYTKKNQCFLCPKNCKIPERKRGFCRARININGEIYTKCYGEAENSYHYAADPIEKKPLYHFYPASYAFSFGTPGCNLRCKHCQNWTLSQATPENVEKEYLKPEKVVEFAKKNNCLSIAYTYSEPTIFFEYMVDTAKLAREEGIKNIIVTNGYINMKPLKELLKYIDAANIDIKSFSEEFYKNICSGELKPVLRSAEYCCKKIHVELTYLIIPTLNDSEKEISNFVEWASSLDTPVHFSRYFPHYKLGLSPTPIETLKRVREIALEKLKYVYLGNIREYNDTYCPNCKNLAIERFGFSVKNYLEKGKCRSCGEPIAIE